MIDCTALVSYILYILTFPNWNLNKHHKRRLFLKQLGRELVNPEINRRIQYPLTLHAGVKEALKSLGVAIPHPQLQQPAAPSLKRCLFCPRSSDRRTQIICNNCKLNCCKEHQIIICPACHGII